jgi:hypothetical protein
MPRLREVDVGEACLFAFPLCLAKYVAVVRGVYSDGCTMTPDLAH